MKTGGRDSDFSNVVFDGGDFQEAGYIGGTVSFVGAQFTSGLEPDEQKENTGPPPT